MDPETSAGVGAPLSGQDASAGPPSAGAEMGASPAPEVAPREARVTRTLASDGAADAKPQVERSAWLRDEDYWRKVTYMSATGRRPGDRLATRPLPRPDRFPTPSRLRSTIILSLVIALMILTPIGIIVARNAVSHITIPTTIPGFTQPTVTPAPAPTLTPTATPKKKK
jgi:hypothetical protein